MFHVYHRTLSYTHPQYTFYPVTLNFCNRFEHIESTLCVNLKSKTSPEPLCDIPTVKKRYLGENFESFVDRPWLPFYYPLVFTYNVSEDDSYTPTPLDRVVTDNRPESLGI